VDQVEVLVGLLQPKDLEILLRLHHKVVMAHLPHRARGTTVVQHLITVANLELEVVVAQAQPVGMEAQVALVMVAQARHPQ
jgi:hypothetical protein